MTTEEKVELLEGVWKNYSLAPALAAVELPKSTWYSHRNEQVSYEEKNAHLLPALEAIAQEHLEYGGGAGHGMILHQDQDPVFTSYMWTAQLLRKDSVRLSYALRGA
jgi:hypothetical protein